MKCDEFTSRNVKEMKIIFRFALVYEKIAPS